MKRALLLLGLLAGCRTTVDGGPAVVYHAFWPQTGVDSVQIFQADEGHGTCVRLFLWDVNRGPNPHLVTTPAGWAVQRATISNESGFCDGAVADVGQEVDATDAAGRIELIGSAMSSALCTVGVQLDLQFPPDFDWVPRIARLSADTIPVSGPCHPAPDLGVL